MSKLDTTDAPSNLNTAVAQATENLLAQSENDSQSKIYPAVIHTVESALLEVVMTYTRRRQTRAAKLLGISRNTLRTKLIAHFGDKYCKMKDNEGFDANEDNTEDA